jgi:hypothetical protein
MNAPIINTPAPSNDKAYTAQRAKFLREARSYGEDGGDGARSLPKLALLALRGAYEGLFSPAVAPKKATGAVATDDAKILYAAYIDGYSKKDTHGSVTQQESKLRAFLKVGKRQDIDAIDEYNRWYQAWAALRDAESNAKRKTSESEYKALLNCATAQIATGQQGPLTDDQIANAIRKTPAAEKDFAKLIKEAKDRLEKARGLDASADLVDLAEDAERLLERILGFIAQDEERTKAQEEKHARYQEFLKMQAEFACAAE